MKNRIDVFCEDKKNYELFIGFKSWTDRNKPFLMRNFSVKTGFLKGTGHDHIKIVIKSIKQGNRVLLVGDFDSKDFADKTSQFIQDLTKELNCNEYNLKKYFFMVGTDNEPEHFKTSANLPGRTNTAGEKLAEDWFNCGGANYWSKYLTQCKHETQRLCELL